MRIVLVSLLMMASSFALAKGVAVFTGTGTVSTAPEFVTVQITVQSQCWKTSDEARLSNDEVVHKIQGILKGFKKGSDELKTAGGRTSQFYPPTYGDLAKAMDAACSNTFQKTTTLTFKTFDVAGFSKALTDIQNAVLPEGEQGAEDVVGPTTFVTIDSPWTGISKETRAAMVEQATELARANAEVMFWAAFKSLSPRKVRIIKATDGSSGSSSYDRGGYELAAPAAAYAGSRSKKGPVVETSFEDISVTRNLIVTFGFDEIRLAGGAESDTESSECVDENTQEQGHSIEGFVGRAKRSRFN